MDLGLLTWKDGHHMLGEKSHLPNGMNPFFFLKYMLTCIDALSKCVYYLMYNSEMEIGPKYQQCLSLYSDIR